jgi:hypothetical protein
LTISGGATTTGNQYIVGALSIATTSTSEKLNITGNINIGATFGLKINGTNVLAGSTTKQNYYIAGATNNSASNQGTYNYALGVGAMALTTGTSLTGNIAIGRGALTGTGTGLSGQYNVGVGDAAVYAISSGSNNVGVGQSALIGVSTGSYNIGIGPQAGNGAPLISGVTITGEADNGSGGTTVSFLDPGQVPVVGDRVTISGTTNYNGTYTITAVNPGTSIDINKAFTVNDGAVGQFTTFGFSGSNNIAVGYQSMYNNATGSSNLAIEDGVVSRLFS